MVDCGSGAGGGTTLTGTLGSLGPAQTPVNCWVTSNFLGETLIYITTAPLTCQAMAGSWLGTLPTDSQVVELVVSGGATVGMTSGEVNYVQGGTSSVFEQAGNGTITFTTVNAMMEYDGTFSGNGIMGTLQCMWCQGGTEY